MSLSEPLLEEAGNRSQYLHPRELVLLTERHEPADGERPGVDRVTVTDHAAALDERGSHVDIDEFEARLEEAVTDTDTWADDHAVYALGDGRLSAYPAAWHDALGGETDLVAFVRFLVEESSFDGVDARAGDGVPEQDLLNVAAAVGDRTREEAKTELERLRDEGRLVEDADQHPDAGVYPPESEQEPDVDADRGP